jgi:hypothetical protein
MVPELSGYRASAHHNGPVWQEICVGMNAFLSQYQLVRVPTDCQTSDSQVTGTPTVSVLYSLSRERALTIVSIFGVRYQHFGYEISDTVYLIMLSVACSRLKGKL